MPSRRFVLSRTQEEVLAALVAKGVTHKEAQEALVIMGAPACSEGTLRKVMNELAKGVFRNPPFDRARPGKSKP